MRSILILLFLLTLAAPALAVDGVLEINQTCAVQTGCFSGDAPGYPVTIDGSAGRSYRLTGDLGGSTFPGGPAAVTFIEISADDVSLDLGGFQISCSTVLGGRCSGAGSGVSAPGDPPVGTSVKNGSITGMATYGVFLGEQAEVSDLRVHGNGLDGISALNGSTVTSNTTYQNGSDGILTLFGSTVSGNTAYQNVRFGLNTGSGSTVSGNTARENGQDGIAAFTGSTILGNTAFLNGGSGIIGKFNSTVRGNTVSNNGTRPSGGYGLDLNSGSAYSANVINDNTTGAVSGGINLGDNYCAGTGVTSATCP